MRHFSSREEYDSVKEPVRIALIGAGNRSSTVYNHAFDAIRDLVELVAVCDPVREHADALAQRFGVHAFYDIRELIRANIAEAAVVSAPIPVHFGYSVLLSNHKIHHLVETVWCNLIAQAREMARASETNGVVATVAENFIRMPMDRFARVLRASNEIGPISRVVCYSDFCGYHNNARWLRFANTHPSWVQGLAHEMRTPLHSSLPHRTHQAERFEARFFQFPGTLFVSDQAANIKGLLGRYPRPGYTEWHGECGTLAYTAPPASPELRFTTSYPFATTISGPVAMVGTGELRICRSAPAGDVEVMSGLATEYVPVECEQNGPAWSFVRARGKSFTVEFENSLAWRTRHLSDGPWDIASVIETLVDFVLAVRKVRPCEVSAKDAGMCVEMEMGARESMLRGGMRIKLPIDDDLEAESIERERLRGLYGVDPLDVEGVVDVIVPRP
jgi:hypothetical protein